MRQLANLLSDRGGLPREEIGDGLRKHRIAQPMAAVNRDRHGPAAELMRTLRSGFESAQALVDGVLDEAYYSAQTLMVMSVFAIVVRYPYLS